MKLLLAVILTFCFLNQGRCDELSGVPTLKDIIDSTRQHHPKIIEAISRVEGAGGKYRSALGGFDPVLSLQSRAYASGYYEGSNSTESKVAIPFEFASSDLFLQLRSGHGNFPVYEDEYDTLDTGELGAGVEFSLLRDFGVDKRRTKLLRQQLEIVRKQHLLDAKQLLVLRDAAEAYWAWQISLGKIQVFRDLLDVGERRQRQFEELVRQGQLAPIEALDNSRTILKRREKLVEQEQKTRQLAQKLSIYWRDELGNPRKIKGQVKSFSLPAIKGPGSDVSDRMLESFEKRPDVMALKTALSALEAKLALAENDLLPKLDLKTSVTRDYGDGEISREDTEWKGMLNFEVPLYRRDAKGRVQEAEAERGALKQQIRLLHDDMRTLSEALEFVLENLAERIKILTEEVGIAERLEKAELEKFKAGNSTLLLVAIRELETADVRGRRLEALLENRKVYLNVVTLLADQNLFKEA